MELLPEPPTEPEPEPYVSIDHIASLLSVGRQSIRRMVALGQIPCHKLSIRTWRFKVTEVIQAIERSKGGAS